VNFLVYATCLGAGDLTRYAPVGDRHDDPAVGFVSLLSAIERQQVHDAGHRWGPDPRGLGWELWQVGFIPRPLAAATDTDPHPVVRPALYDLLGGVRPVLDLHTWWADTFYTVGYQAPSRATTVRSLTPANGAGTDLGSETTA